jgi:tetratricopeptide (TPR) repeat protein
LVAAILCTSLATGVDAGALRGESPRARHQRGLAAVDSLATAGDWESVAGRAEAELADVGLDEDLRWRLHQRAGLALQRLGRRDAALVHLEQAVLWGPVEPANHRNLATLLVALDRRGRALAEYGLACDLDPADCAVRLEHAHVLIDYGLLREATTTLANATGICDPDDPRLLRARARCRLADGDPVAALPDLERLHELAPTPQSGQQLALARLRAGRPEAARLLLAPRWRHDLDDQGLRILLEADAALGDPEHAVSLALSLGEGGARLPHDAQVWSQAALVCIGTNRDREGLILIDQAIALSPDDPALRHNRVLLLRRLGRTDEADREWARVLALDPSRIPG